MEVTQNLLDYIKRDNRDFHALIPGDVVVCIDVDSELSYLEKNLNNRFIIDGKLLLTFGKKYTIEGLSFENYSLKNDNGYYSDYKHSRFVTNYEFRNDKINKILE